MMTFLGGGGSLRPATVITLVGIGAGSTGGCSKNITVEIVTALCR
jgi:hypothetical protein